MDIAWVAVKERRRSLQAHHSIASSEPDETSRAAAKADRSEPRDIPSPEGFAFSDIEGDGDPELGVAAPGATTTIAAPGADGQPTLGNGQQVQQGDRLMLKDRAVEVIELTKVNNKFLAECVYLPRQTGVQALPVGISLDCPDLRHLSDEEKQALEATGGEGGRTGRGGTGRGGKKGRGKGRKGQTGKGKGDKQQGEVKGHEEKQQKQKEDGAEQNSKAKGAEQNNKAKEPRSKGVGGKRAKKAVPDATAEVLDGTSAVPDAEATGAAQHTEAPPSPSKAIVATQDTHNTSSPCPKTKGRKPYPISPDVSTYKTAASAGRAAYRRVLLRGGSNLEANARNTAVMKQWRKAKFEPAPGGEDPGPAAPAKAEDAKPATEAEAAQPSETQENAKGEWIKARLAELKAEAEEKGQESASKKLFGQAVSEWFAKCKEDAQREQNKIALALAHEAPQECRSPLKVGMTGASPEASPQASPMSAPGDNPSPASGAKRTRLGVKVSRRRWRKSAPPSGAEEKLASAGSTASSSANAGATEALPAEEGETNPEAEAAETNPEAEAAETKPEAKAASDEDEDLGMDMDELLG